MSLPEGQAAHRTTLHAPSPRGANFEPTLRVFINEWMARNTIGILDPADSARDDWFELHNAEARTIDLGGYYLSDTPGQNTKYRIPANGRYTIGPGNFLVVFADNQTSQNSATRSNLHVNFQLGSSAGTISLYAPDGLTLIDSITYAQQTNDVSEGRYSDGASARYFMSKPTPSSANSLLPAYNTRPRFPLIAHQYAAPGERPTINIAAIEPDYPVQSLVYSIDSAPAVSALNQGGLYRWTVPTNQPAGDYPITLSVTDNGTPPRSATTTFTITIRPPTTPTIVRPVIYALASGAGQVTFTFDTVPERTYRILYKDDLNAPAWTPLDRDFVAANATGSITDVVPGAQRFYQVQKLD